MKTLSIFTLSILMLLGCNQSQSNNSGQNPVSSPQSEVTAPGISADTLFTFDNYTTGKSPEGWSNYFTGKGHTGKWEIIDENGNKVLAQTSMENYGYHFDVIVNDNLEYKDLEITVKFKGVKGEEDQGGGPVWRYRDADNYYIARANPLENNFRVYKVVNGNRRQLKSVNMEINTGQWYTMKITMKGNKIKCYLDGELKLEAVDDTFENSGKTGLWTKADAVTYFDNLEIKPIK